MAFWRGKQKNFQLEQMKKSGGEKITQMVPNSRGSLRMGRKKKKEVLRRTGVMPQSWEEKQINREQGKEEKDPRTRHSILGQKQENTGTQWRSDLVRPLSLFEV